jgi:hypothetical protein
MVSRKLTPRKNLKRKYSPRRSQKKSLRSPKRTPPWHRKRKFDDEEEEEDIVYKLTTKKTAPVSSVAPPPPPTKVEIDEISITTEIQPLIIDVEDKIIESEIQTPKVSIDEIALNCEIIQAARRPIVSDIDIDEVTISSEIKEPTVKIDEIFLTGDIVSKEVNLDEILITTQINPLSVKIDEIVLSTVINPVEVELTDITLTTEINTPKIDVNDIIVTSQINSPQVEIDEKTVTTLINPTQVEIEEVFIKSFILPKIIKAFDISLPIEASDIPLPETEEIDIDRVILRGEIKPSVVEVDPLTITSQINPSQVLVDDVTIASQINSPQVFIDDVTITSQINPPQVLVDDVTITSQINPSQVFIDDVTITSQINPSQVDVDDVTITGQINPPQVEVQEVLLTSSIQPPQNLVVDDVTITGQIIPIKVDINKVDLTSTIDIPQVEINDVAVTTQIIPPQVDIEEVVLTTSINQEIPEKEIVDAVGIKIDGQTYKSMSDLKHLSILKSTDDKHPTIIFMSKEIDAKVKSKKCELNHDKFVSKIKPLETFEIQPIISYGKRNLEIKFENFLIDILVYLYYYKNKSKKGFSLLIEEQREKLHRYDEKLNSYDSLINKMTSVEGVDIEKRYQNYVLETFKIDKKRLESLKKFIHNFVRNSQVLSGNFDDLNEWVTHFVNNRLLIKALKSNFSGKKQTQICYIDNEKDREVIKTFLTKTENLYELIMDENKGKDDVCMKFTDFLDFDALNRETLEKEKKPEEKIKPEEEIKPGKEIKPEEEIKPEKKINSEEEKKKVKERELEVIEDILKFITTTDNVSEVKNKFGDALINKVRAHISSDTTKNEKEFTVEAGGTQYNLNLSSTASVGSRKAIIVKNALNPMKDGNIIWNWKCKDEAVKVRFKIYIKYVNRSEEFAHECIYDTGDVEKNSDSGILLRSEDYLDNEIYFIWDNSYSISTSKTIIFTLSSSVTLNVVDYEPSPSVEWKVIGKKVGEVFIPSHPLIKKN